MKVNRLGGIDWIIVVPVLYLLALGLTVVQSIYSTAQYADFDMASQYIAAGVGVLAMFLISRTDKRVWVRLGPILYGVSVVLLAATLLFGPVINGAQRWLLLGPLQLQPAELGKFGLIAMLARLLSKRREGINKPWTLLLSIIYVAIPTTLILFQPDLSTAIIYVAVWFGMLMASYLKPAITVMVGGIMLLAVPLMLPLLANYQYERIETFLNPQHDTAGQGYNALQASIAIGSGGLLGKGLDSGSQSQLNFLPSQQTDFVFAVVAEKLGLIGSLSVIVAFAVLLGRLLYKSWLTQHEYMGYVTFAVFVLLSTQVVLNIGMNLGIIPVTGLPLPLLSYGGTHLITELALIGFVLSNHQAGGSRRR